MLLIPLAMPVSSLESAIANSQQDNYLIVAVISLIGYDYMLLFLREIEYIWTKPWTLVSTLFVVIRYLGLCAFITLPLSLAGPPFLPRPEKVGSFAKLCIAAEPTLPTYSCAIFQIVSLWTVFGFICAADLIMILRVWAVYNRSRIILGSLLMSYVMEIIPSFVNCVVYTNPRYVPVIVTQIQGFSFCALEPASLAWNKATGITQLIHGALMCTLVVVQFVRRSLGLYKATKQWRLNRFINLFVMEGVAYFLAMLAWNIVSALFAWGRVTTDGWQAIPLAFVTFVPIPTLTPRFVLNLRALYACNVQCGRASGIDSGFGLSEALSTYATSRSAIVFADGDSERNEEVEYEEVPTEVEKAWT